MPINNFEGNTFVAFVDISGFKELIRQEKRAWEALDRFYQLGYDILKKPSSPDNTLSVEGIFVSDCGVLFIRGDNSNAERLLTLLKAIQEINKGMLEKGFMLTTSIAYGPFKYQQRIEFPGIEKNAVYGSAYLGAYLDNAAEKPTIQPGQCRIVIDNLPQEVLVQLDNNGPQGILKKVRKESNKHYYFYWNITGSEEIADFKQRYNDSYNLKYEGMLKALKGE